MLKKELLEKLALDFPGVAKKDLLDIVEVLFECMTRALEKGDPVVIRGFGRLSVTSRSPIRARNPRSGEFVDVARRWAVHFKPSENLHSFINND